MDFSKPHTVDIGLIQHEMTVNYLNFVALRHAFMPFFRSRKSKVSGVSTTNPIMRHHFPVKLLHFSFSTERTLDAHGHYSAGASIDSSE